MKYAMAEPKCYAFGILMTGAPPFSTSFSTSNTLGYWAMGSSIDLEETPLRAYSTPPLGPTPW